MREPSEEIDFGPAEPEGRSQTWPVELLAALYSYRSLLFLLYLVYIQQEVLV